MYSVSIFAETEEQLLKRFRACLYINQTMTGDLQKILELTDSQKAIRMESLKDLVATIPDSYRKIICRSATQEKFDNFIKYVDKAKDEVGNEDLNSLSYGGIAYLIQCDKGRNALTFNMEPLNLEITPRGFSSSTQSLIQHLGPLLLEPDHSGITPYEYAKLKHSQFSDGSPQKKFYKKMMDYIEFIEEDFRAYRKNKPPFCPSSLHLLRSLTQESN